MCIVLPEVPVETRRSEGESIGGRRMFFFYFNKLGWPGSILLSVVLTVLLFLAFRLLNG